MYNLGMRDFKGVKFFGEFRTYQQRVLDSSDKYLKNNKIHIVAAPGSGKTILGLELIKRLNSPCIVLSPTNTIRYQWGDRFESMYLPKGKTIDEFVSFDLNNVKPITSITYQAMHSAINKIACVDEDNNKIDYSNIDMFKLMNEYGIKTVCVDEAHHLQNEWQKALEVFMKGLGKDVKVIALTATPPYDATETEWNRYIKICGEIDEEIFVNELVKAKNLCPHQDYVYLNYPTKEESLVLNKFKETVLLCLQDLKDLEVLKLLPAKLEDELKNNEDVVFKSVQNYISVLGLLNKLEIPFNENLFKKEFKVKEFPKSLLTYETALNFLLNNKTLLSNEEKEELLNKIKQFGLIERNKVCLETNSKIEKKLLLSMGKMESIVKIVNCENSALNSNLRMLILTDYIRAKTISKIGTNQIFNDISVVSIFETIRRENPELKMAILSGTLVVLPTNLVKKVKELLGKKSGKISSTPLLETGYSEVEFNTSNKEKVSVVGKLFENGDINIVVGTKSLLGEGWDSPCINSLIMASFVGSFMLSNQMRGRAIRTYKNDENKTANIWHLVTLEPENAAANQKIDCTEESSSDYKTLTRRFNCFVGPHYEKVAIESGIERVSILKKSYTKETVLSVNKQMEELAVNRNSLWDKWQVGKGKGLMYMQSLIPVDRKPKQLATITAIQAAVSFVLTMLLFFVLPNLFSGLIFKTVCYFFAFVLTEQFIVLTYKAINLNFVKLFVKSIANGIKKGLLETNNISSNGKIRVSKTKEYVKLSIELENIREQKVFLTCVKELLNPIADGRYLMLKTVGKVPVYRFSYQLPEIFSVNKDSAILIKKRLLVLSPSKLLYTKNTENSKMVYMCKKYSYINSVAKPITEKQVG